MNNLASTLSEKADALKSQFLPPMPNANPANILNTSYPAAMPSPVSILEEEISYIIRKLHPFKAAGSDGIPLFIVK
jgi:hypothetical protein